MSFDTRAVRRAFGRAAADYDDHAWLQAEVRGRLLERLDEIEIEPGVVLDLGCGTGRGAAALKRRYRKAQVIGADLATPMVAEMRRRQSGWRRPLHGVVADAARPPLARHSVDLVFANLTLQWCEQPEQVFSTLCRVLRPGGVLLFSTFGPDTLGELRDAWSAVGGGRRTSEFIDLHTLGDWLIQTGYREPVMDAERITSTYARVRDLLDELKAIGASNAHTDRPRGLTTATRLREMARAYEQFRTGAGLPATWEVVYGMARGPAEGQPVRTGQGEVASFSVDSLRRR